MSDLGREAYAESVRKDFAAERAAAEQRPPEQERARKAFELKDAVVALRATCPICGHTWRRHDPEDGCCDAHSDELIGVCQCGRDMAWMHAKVATLSREALAANPSEEEAK